MRRVVIGVFPAGTIDQRATLWPTLGRAFDVTFVDGATHGGSLTAAIGVGDGPLPGGIPALVVSPTAGGSPGGRMLREAMVRLADRPEVDVRLRSLRVPEAGVAAGEPIALGADDRVLASGPTGPVWTIDDEGRMRCAATLPDLAEGARLKEHLRPGRFLALTAITHLLRAVTAYADWSRPPLRATITFDDPNLRRGSYGFIRFPELAAHAVHHGYHVGIATVPLDGGRAHDATVDCSDGPVSSRWSCTGTATRGPSSWSRTRSGRSPRPPSQFDGWRRSRLATGCASGV